MASEPLAAIEEALLRSREGNIEEEFNTS